MNTLFILTAALLPPIALWAYICAKDPQPEPLSWLVKAVIWGIATCFPVAYIEMGISNALFGEGGEPTTLWGTTAQAFLAAALPEEAFKLLALWLLLRRNLYFDEHFDGIVYAVCVGLGFAAIENLLYVFSYEDWLYVSVSRALLAVPGHYAFAIMMGYYYSIYHFVDHSTWNGVCILLVPVVAHGIYDALAMSGAVSPYVGAITFLALIYFCVKMQKVARRRVLAMIEEDRHIAKRTT